MKCKYSVEKVQLQPGSIFGAGIAGAAGAGVRAQGWQHRFLGLREKKLCLQKEKNTKYKLVSIGEMRSLLAKLSVSRKNCGTWELSCLSWCYLFCSISSWSSGCCKGKNRSRGNMQIAARLTSLFSSLSRYTAGKFSSSVRRNP